MFIFTRTESKWYASRSKAVDIEQSSLGLLQQNLGGLRMEGKATGGLSPVPTVEA